MKMNFAIRLTMPFSLNRHEDINLMLINDNLLVLTIVVIVRQRLEFTYKESKWL